MDEDAVAALYREHGAALRRFARGAVGNEKAEDIVQEAIIRVWRVGPPDTQSLRAYLYRTVRNLIVDQHRTASRRPRTVAPVEDGDGFALAVDAERIDELLDRVVMEEALTRLTPEHRQAVVAVHYRRLTVVEAARELGIPAGTVKSRCFYALKALRAALDEMGMER
jgi:RNA polymerase sigma-70 factor (ECF subfamily)